MGLAQAGQYFMVQSGIKLDHEVYHWIYIAISVRKAKALSFLD
ncbi:MAG: hypothetical protein Q7U12_17990 [Undibacterium sp.]|nr:hypothetical protein [Undibacterium sp.]MDO9194794.1 hypothetical protein [Undibacterium sp.]